MMERLKNLCAYFLVAFNLIVGAISLYTTVAGLTSSIFLIIVGIVVILGLCGSIASIVEKAYKPLSDKVSELSEGSFEIADKFKFESLRIRDYAQSHSTDPEAMKIEVLRGSYYIVLQIKDVLRNAIGKKVRVCIKMFRNDEEGKIFTYCRDSLSIEESIKKEHSQRIDVSRNSDFADILNGNKDIFIGGDLRKDYQAGKYHNTNRDFKYSSTVVVPIRALKTEVDGEKYYDNIGFLCVDSKHKNLFSNSQAKMCVDLIKASAQYLYVFISQGNEYYSTIMNDRSKEGKND